MTERDRNPDILATADRLAEMTGGLEYRRDAIYDALASSSASGAGQMREAAAKVAHVEDGLVPKGRAFQGNADYGPRVAERIEALIRALPLPESAPAPARRPKVKGLVWDNEEAETAIGSYEVVKYGRAFAVYLDRNLVTGEPASLEAAKAAAQRDFEDRILACLEDAS